MKYLHIYRNISVPASAITLLSCYLYLQWHTASTLAIVLWMKVIATAALILYVHLFKSNILVFFMNLGVGRTRFYASMFVVDMMFFVVLISIISLVK